MKDTHTSDNSENNTAGVDSASSSAGGVSRIRDLVPLAVGLLRRPALIPAALNAALSLAPRQWWKKAPYLPIPDDGFVRFRQATANGDPNSPIELEDFLEWLEWRQLHQRR